jgi:hypothetical protein
MKVGEIVRIARGVVTGNAALFIMTRARAKERGLEEFAKTIVAGKREFPTTGAQTIHDTPQRLVILIASRRDVEQHTGLREYLAGIEPKLSTVRPAPIAVSYIGTPRFVANPDGLLITNALYTGTPRQNMTPREVLALVERLNAAMKKRPKGPPAERFSPRQLEQIDIA